jgi:alkylation response protein AidB-like acyl-CoA dehydrogenase
MTDSAAPASSASPAPTGAELHAAADRAAALARELAPLSERERALPEQLLEQLRSSGLLRAGAPAELGAAQAPPADTLACAEKIARGDASAGWCVSIAATSSLLAASLPADGAAEVLGGADAVAAGVWAPRGIAVPVDGGVRISGRWSFCSGIAHSDWLFAGCLLDGDQPAAAGQAPSDTDTNTDTGTGTDTNTGTGTGTGAGASAGGARAPVMRVAALPTAELEILDTWHTSGLRGTGSQDALAEDLFVPERRLLSLLDAAPRVDAPLYRFPIFGFFALSIAAAALGNARGAIDELLELAAGKTSLGSTRVLAERPATQAAVGEAEAALRAARALYYEAIDEAWIAAQTDAAVGVPLRLGLRLAATHAVRSAADVVRSMYDLAGGTAIYEDSPLQRRFRDAHTATAHFQVNPATWELAGRVLLDLPSKTAQL